MREKNGNEWRKERRKEKLERKKQKRRGKISFLRLNKTNKSHMLTHLSSFLILRYSASWNRLSRFSLILMVRILLFSVVYLIKLTYFGRWNFYGEMDLNKSECYNCSPLSFLQSLSSPSFNFVAMQ
jgi:hypothetical protein